MEIDKYKNIILGWFKSWFDQNYRSGVPRIPPHTHNNVDNLPININDTTGNLPTSRISGNVGSSLEVTDTITDVTGVTKMDFPAGSVSNPNPNEVSITISATPAGSDTQVQYNKAGAFGASSIFTKSKVVAGFDVWDLLKFGQMQLWSTGTTGKGFISSPNDIQIIPGLDRVTGTQTDHVVELLAGGYGLQVSPTSPYGFVKAMSNLGITGGTPDFGGGFNVVFIADAAVLPSTTPTGGGILYSSGGALHWLGSSGTDTTIAPA